MPSGFRVVHLLYEPRPSGISRHVLEVVRALPDVGHALVVPAGLEAVADQASALGADVRVVPMRSRVLPRSALRGLPAAVRAARADLVHLHSLEAGGFGTLAARLGGARRVVFTPQTTEIRLRALLPAYRRVLRVTGRWHRVWIAVSRGQQAQLERLAPGISVRLVPNAAPALGPLPARDAARARLGWPLDAFVVAAVGRLSAQKDPLTFVRAARAHAGPALWALVGDGPLRGEVERAAQGLANVRVQGHVAGVEDVLAGADVVALVSRWEGLPYSLLEAMAAGVPVVASRIDGNVDLVEDERTGLLVAPGDAHGLAAAVERLRRDPSLGAALAAAARRHVEERFSRDVMASGLRAAYAEALGS